MRAQNVLVVVTVVCGLALTARAESPPAFGGRCIPRGCVAPPSNTPGILGRPPSFAGLPRELRRAVALAEAGRALPGGRIARLGATGDFHHGLSAAPGSAEDRPIDTRRSTITVRVFKAGLFRAFADDHIIQAPLAEGSLDDSATPHVQIVVDARQMRVLDPGLSAKDRQEVQTRMLGPEVLDVNRFHWISFHSLAIQPLNAGRWLVRGELELHGRFHAITVNVFLEKSRYKGSATLRQSDFGIVPISIVGGAVKVKDEINIDFDIAITERLTAAAGGTIRKGR